MPSDKRVAGGLARLGIDDQEVQLVTVGHQHVSDLQQAVVAVHELADLVFQRLGSLTHQHHDIVIFRIKPLEHPHHAAVAGNFQPVLFENGACGEPCETHTRLAVIEISLQKSGFRFPSDLPKSLRASARPRSAPVAQRLIVVVVVTQHGVPAIQGLDGDIPKLLMNVGEQLSGTVGQLEHGARHAFRLLGLRAAFAPFHNQSKTGQPNGVRPVGNRDIAGRNGRGNGAFGDGLGDLDARGFGHGGKQPFLPAAATGARARLPAFADCAPLN